MDQLRKVGILDEEANTPPLARHAAKVARKSVDSGAKSWGRSAAGESGSRFRRHRALLLFPLLLLLAAFACAESDEDSGPKSPDTSKEDPNKGTDKDSNKANACARSFDYATGYPCNFDTDCASGHCVDDGFRRLCASPCESAACARHDEECVNIAEQGTFCLPNIDTPLPFRDESLEQGSPCFSDMDCADGAFCTNLDGVWICAASCQNSSECGECYSCRSDLPSPGGSGNLCAPQGEVDIGKACESAYECSSFECHGFCTQQCTFGPCPEGSECERVGKFSVCVSPEQRGATSVGQSCWYDFECATGSRCQLNSQGEKSCAPPRQKGESCEIHEECADGLRCIPNATGSGQTCEKPGVAGAGCQADSDCAEGHSCRDFALNTGACTRDCSSTQSCGEGFECVAAEVDTYLELWDDSDDPYPLLENDDFDYSRGLLWSRMDFEPEESGRYFLAIRTLANTGGPYRLVIQPPFVDPAQEPLVVNEEESKTTQGSNDSKENAQQLPALPEDRLLIVEGKLENSEDLDYFAFDLSTLGRIRLETRRSSPSACLASAVVGSIPPGEPCSFHYQCGLEGICDTALEACTFDCSHDISSCPQDFACVDVESALGCVEKTRLRQTEVGESCQFTFECDEGDSQASPICVKEFSTEGFCSLRCETISCDEGLRCEPVFPRQAGVGVLKAEACVPGAP